MKKKAIILVIITIVMIRIGYVCGQSYSTIMWDDHPMNSNVPYCAGDSIKCVPPSGVTGIIWSPGLTTHGDTLVLASGFDGVVTCFYTGGQKKLYIRPIAPPVIPSFSPTDTLCGIETKLLNAGNVSIYGFTSYLWNTGATTQSILADTAGIYSVTVSNLCGLVNKSSQIWKFNTNKPDLGPDITACEGSTILLSPGTGYSDYLWTGGTILSTLVPTTSGIYTVQTTNTSDGCIDKDTIIITFLTPPSINVCFVEFDTITYKNRIVWHLPPSNAEFVNIYSEISTNVFSLIGSVPSTQTSYIDMTSNPANQSNSYKISIKDTCSNEGIQSALHKTITLLKAYDQLTNTYGFTWSAYQGLTVPNYLIYGITSSNQVAQIASVPGNTYFYNYTNPSSMFVKYFVGFYTPNCGSKDDYIVRSNYVNSATSSISENQFSTINIYPNPFKNELIIYSKGNTEILNFEILNSIGKVIYKGNLIDKTIVETSNFTTGIYLVKIGNGNAFEIRKIVKE